MDPSSAQHHHQEMSSQTLESMLVCTKAQQDKKPRPAEQALKCPRCDSTNTKFCYYNNYSLTQPRYFCKSCRRYWTKGGTLRNVPVGGGCRRNKRSSSKRSCQDQPLTNNSLPHPLSSLNPMSYDSGEYSSGLARGSEILDLGRDGLSLAIARLQKQASGKLGFEDNHEFQTLGGQNNHHNFDGVGNPNNIHFDALRNGFLETSNGFHNFYYGNVGHVENGGGIGMSVGEEMAMPFEELNGAAAATTSTTVKQEMCNGRENENNNNNNRVLWGFPWQINGGDVTMADLDTGRQNWNGFGSTWHGLLNGPLM